jgi:hypothetical protein
VFVLASSLATMFFDPLVTQTASSVTTCQSGLPATGNTAIGLIVAIALHARRADAGARGSRRT